MVDLRGIFPPLPTSFDQDENLDTAKMIENIQSLNNHDLSGYLVLGSNGELVHLSTEEKKSVYTDCRPAIPEDKLMLAGVGGQSTRETQHLCDLAAEAGADAALVLNPSYYKGLMSRQVLVNHFYSVADQSAIPVIIYNMPANSGLDMDADTIIEMSAHQNIIGLKDSGGNLTKMAGILESVEESFQVLSGSAGFLFPALSIGACGGILAFANIAPQVCIDIQTAFDAGDYDTAARLQKKIVKLNTMITRGWGVPALKTAMDHLGLYGGPARKPLPELDAEKKTTLLKTINKILNP